MGLGDPGAVIGEEGGRGVALKPSLGRLLLLLLVSAACREAGRAYRLATALNHEFDGSRVGVSVTDGLILTVSVLDSSLANVSCETRVGVAMRVGRILRRHGDELESLQVVNVAFVPGRKATLPIRFSAAMVRSGPSASDSAGAVRSCQAYEELN